MKDEIIAVLQSCVNVWDIEASGGSPVPIMKDEYIWITEGIQRLMCYREVRAFTHGRSVYLNVPNLLVALFKEFYSKELILEAIEKVKNEQNAG